MTQVLHISDIHFEEESADQDSVLAALKHSIQKLTFDVVVVSGDIARTGTAAQFERAKGYIETVAAGRPALVVPGNHDVDRSRIDQNHLERIPRISAGSTYITKHYLIGNP